MVSFTIIMVPFFYLGLAHFISVFFSFIKGILSPRYSILSQLFTSLILLLICVATLNLTKIQNYHTDWKPNDNHKRAAELLEKEFIESLSSQLRDGEHVIFNASITENGHIPIMFYTDHTAYDFIPTQSQIDEIKRLNRKIAVVNTAGLPSYITEDNEIIVLEVRPTSR